MTKWGTVEPFSADICRNRGYIYTTNASLSSRYANERITKATLQMVSIRDRRLIDIGCGDGAFTVELFDRGHPTSITAIDPCEDAIRVAQEKKGERAIEFCSYHILPREGSEDCAPTRAACCCLLVSFSVSTPCFSALSANTSGRIYNQEKSAALSRR